MCSLDAIDRSLPAAPEDVVRREDAVPGLDPPGGKSGRRSLGGPEEGGPGLLGDCVAARLLAIERTDPE